MKVSGLVDTYEAKRLPLLARRTRATYKHTLSIFRTFFVEHRKDPEVQDVRRGHVVDFLNWRRVHPQRGKGTVSNRTVGKDRTVLHTLFAFAEELELRDGNPVAKVKAPRSEPRDPIILDEEQYERLPEECSHNAMLWLYVLVMGETGGRSYSEVLYLQWGDVDLEEGFVRIRSGRERHRTKSGKGRWVPVTQRLRQAIRDHFAAYRFATYGGKPTSWIFHHVRERRRAKAGERIRGMPRAFTNAAARAKLPPELHQHDLWHRRVTT